MAAYHLGIIGSQAATTDFEATGNDLSIYRQHLCL
jgi:hypothetical protein